MASGRVKFPPMAQTEALTALEPGMKLVVGGNRTITVDSDLARAFGPGDSLALVETTGEVLHIPSRDREVATSAVTQAVRAFDKMRMVKDSQISQFFDSFAHHLERPDLWAEVARENAQDVERAQARGRSTTRLKATEKMRLDMIEGLRGWARASSVRGRVFETVDHGSWRAELVGAELGVVAFVFEGRPNVVADATGVLRSGNTVCFRIGSDALGTAKKILELCTRPALEEAGLPEGAVTIVDSTAHAAGWALFSDPRLALAVARGSGPAVASLGSLAQSAGIPVSLHGTGGAWLVASSSASSEKLQQNVFDSLDRKVCNTLNTCCVVRSAAERLIPSLLEGLRRAGERRGTTFKLHVAEGDQAHVPPSLFEEDVEIGRAAGPVIEKQAELIAGDRLGREWEWENTPEITLKVVESVSEAVELFNAQSPRFVACLLSEDSTEAQRFYDTVDAPFVGDGFTRWVDGQYALNRPELGLSNWERGRLFGRGGVLSGDSVLTIRTRVTGTDSGRPK